MKNYIDMKVTLWNRLHFSGQSNMQSIADLIKKGRLDEVTDDKLGFLESETLNDTEEQLNPDDNSNQAIIEVYADGVAIWTNKIK